MPSVNFAERRHRKRYPLQFELEYRVFGKGHSIFAGAARTLNISSEGVLLTPTEGVNRGQVVELSIRWHTGGRCAPRADLEILGRVMRVDSSGTAVRILRYGFYPHGAPAIENTTV
jgi:hypothetical protein